MPGKLIIRTLILLMLLTTGIATVSASPFTTQYEPIRLAAREGVTLDQAVARVKHQTKGRILTAETITRKGQPVHRIKVLLPNGSVRVMYVDAE
ncbi:MAG: PepSY domain-containing protein [Halobacteria archaeon]|nr:PepSY domain-containing protein [Halobacteria archaeon]